MKHRVIKLVLPYSRTTNKFFVFEQAESRGEPRDVDGVPVIPPKLYVARDQMDPEGKSWHPSSITFAVEWDGK